MLLVHALPDAIRVEVRDDAGALLASGDQLPCTADRPIARLTRHDLRPEPDDIGRPVILAGGEAGILTAWWNAPDGQEWRWSIELYNHR